MCLVVPLKVIKKQKNQWLMEDKRLIKSLVGKTKIGDYLICQQNLGIEKVSRNKAKLIRNALRQGL